VPDDLRPPVEPLFLAPGDPSEAHPWRRAVLLAILVVALGAALGAAGFAAEQRLFVWKPNVTPLEGGGWRVTGSAGLRPQAPVLAADHLVWSQGGYTCLMDLDSGDVKVIGAAAHGTDLWPPALDSRSVAWTEADKQGAAPAHLWVYDIGRGRRVPYDVGAASEGPALTDRLVVWLDDSSGGRREVTALDRDTEKRSVIAKGQGIASPVMAGDGVVGWVGGLTPDSAPMVVVRDLQAGTDTAIMLASPGSGLTVGDIQMARRTVLWTQRSSTSARLLAYDLDTGRTTTVADGVVEHPATDGEVAVWTQPGPASAPAVMMRRLAGGAASVAARPTAWPVGLAVGGSHLAWVVNDGTWTYLDVVKLPS
jgi:hypothetical protein